MLFGHRSTLMTNHKPLLSIFGSEKRIPVYSASRLQRWTIILFGYDFDIQYRKTTEFGQADALSRLISSQSVPDDDTVIVAINIEVALTDCIRTIPMTRVEIKRETQRDTMIQKVSKFFRHAWTSDLTGYLQQFKQRRDSLSVIDEYLMFADRVVVPTKLRKAVLKQLHSGYPGINRMKAIARSVVYWPNDDSDIEKIVKNCVPCMEAQKIHLGLWTFTGHTENNHGPEYMWILQALLMAWVFW